MLLLLVLVLVCKHAELGRRRSSDFRHDEWCMELAGRHVVSITAEVLQVLGLRVQLPLGGCAHGCMVSSA